MSMKELTFKIEELQLEAEKIDSLQMTIFEAIFNGAYAPSEYEWATAVLGDLTYSLKGELDKVKDRMFEIIRAEH